MRHATNDAYRRIDSARAFTLIELMVVMGVIGILVALLLPAVQSARELARRAQCTNNIAQVMLAVSTYENVHRAFPPGSIDAAGPVTNRPKGYHHNWFGQVLPFFERPAMYHHIDRKVGIYHPNNAAVRRVDLPNLHCASTPFSGSGYTNYAGVHHDAEAPIDLDNNGVFFLNSSVRPKDVSDGLANTLFLGEKLITPVDLGCLSGTRGTLRNVGEQINRLNAATRAMGRNSVPRFPLGSESEDVSGMGGFGMADLSDTSDPYADDWGDEEGELSKGPLYVGGFASYHPAGANFAMGDGSVRFLHDGISREILRKLANRHDGELLNENY